MVQRDPAAAFKLLSLSVSCDLGYRYLKSAMKGAQQVAFCTPRAFNFNSWSAEYSVTPIFMLFRLSKGRNSLSGLVTCRVSYSLLKVNFFSLGSSFRPRGRLIGQSTGYRQTSQRLYGNVVQSMLLVGKLSYVSFCSLLIKLIFSMTRLSTSLQPATLRDTRSRRLSSG